MLLQNQYRRRLIEKVESVVHRMRWKAHFFQNGKSVSENNKFGLPSKNRAPAINALKGFEDDLTHMINTVSFRKVNDPFLNTVTEGIKKINTSKNVFVFADKTQNIYEVPPSTYTKLLTENITKTYKTENEDITEEINKELKELTNNLGIGNRIDIMAKREAFVTLNDHKENFDSHLMQ